MLERGRNDPYLVALAAGRNRSCRDRRRGAGGVPAGQRAGTRCRPNRPQQVLELMAQHRDASFSGTLEQTSELGLPELPQTGPGTASGDTAWLELLTRTAHGPGLPRRGATTPASRCWTGSPNATSSGTATSSGSTTPRTTPPRTRSSRPAPAVTRPGRSPCRTPDALAGEAARHARPQQRCERRAGRGGRRPRRLPAGAHAPVHGHAAGLGGDFGRRPERHAARRRS